MILIKRPNRDESRNYIYEKMIFNKETNPSGVFSEIRDVFLFSVILGYSEGKRIKLEKKYSFGPGVFDHPKYQDIFAYVALAETKDVKVLIGEFSDESKQNENSIQEIIEEYANGGIVELEKLVFQRKGKTTFDAFEEIISFYNKFSEEENIPSLF